MKAKVASEIFRPYVELYAEGKRLREKCPRTSHAEWKPLKNRPDPLYLLKESSKGRIPELLPIRYGRMLQSPFTFYRGSALSMAEDLSVTPVNGLRVQACGDAHLCNFGAYATPERRVIFDLNDLDESLPAPWEWDVKRLAASFVLACRDNGFKKGVACDVAFSCAQTYRHSMAEFSQMRALDVWYAGTEVEEIIARTKDKEAQKRIQKRVARDGETQGLYGSYGCASLLLRSAKSLAAWHERKHQPAFTAILPARNRPVWLFSSATRPVALRLNQRPRKTLGFQTPASKLQASVASTI